MFPFSWFSLKQQAPPVVDLVVTSSGYNPSQDDDLHNDTVRFVETTPTTKGKSALRAAKTETMSSVSAVPTLPQSSGIYNPFLPMDTKAKAEIVLNDPKAKAQIVLHEVKPELEVMLEGIMQLLAQHLSTEECSKLTNRLVVCAEGAMENTKDILDNLLGEQRLTSSNRDNLRDAILIRMYEYQANRIQRTSVSSPPRPSRAPSVASSATFGPVIQAKKEPASSSGNQANNILSVTHTVRTFKSRTSQGSFTYFSCQSPNTLDQPPTLSRKLEVGDLFFHDNTTTKDKQVWLFNRHSSWQDISAEWKAQDLIIHPAKSDQCPHYQG
ncbi:hypothetical protein B0H16DRAFT_1799325 [Mycena metata]|uniref:Uncharacterized protein n=1 Tax=Mycena metata TaxID=1033252 RepID=A0AAD7HCL7_9AGAR|nr:hypothetical protein B0H16DRAFT_1799325 [Mycena metata]